MGLLTKAELFVGELAESLFRFGKEIQPVELDRMIKQTIKRRKKKLLKDTYAPNHFRLYLSKRDFADFKPLLNEIIEDLARSAHEHMEQNRYKLTGIIDIKLMADDSMEKGKVKVLCAIVE